MAKLTLTDPTNVVGAESSFIAAETANNTAIEAAIENTLSRDGTGPNSMGADLDMNTKNIDNAGTIAAAALTIGGVAVGVINLTWTGPWATTTVYAVNDIVTNNGTSYICITAHTAGDLDDEPGVGAVEATYWDHVADKGDTGATGATGSQGPQGDAGAQGPQGDAGPIGLTWQGAWTTSTAYALNDGVKNSGASFICILAHTSGASNEPEVGGSWTTYWDYVAEQGAAGAGSGDLLAANNLSDVASASASLTNLGGQAQGAVLDDLNTLGAPTADGEFIVATGAGVFAYETAGTARASLGLVIGTDVQAYGAVLDDFNTLGAASADGEFIVASGAGTFVYESGATARTSLGLGTWAVESLGQETIWIPAAAMEPRATTAPATSNVVEIGTSLIALRTMDFATDADDHAGFAIQMPKSWNEGTIIAQFVWSTTGAQTAGLDGVKWFIRAGAYASNDVLTTALGTAVGPAAQDHSATADDIMITAETSPMTVAGSPGAEEWVYFEVYRDVSDAGDDLDIDARLHGVKLHYTVNAGSDT